jgi:L-ascorbate metabolism protein UlaG (beta-lactamase superfamily)
VERTPIELPAGAEVDLSSELTFVGTATVLLRHRGFTILTDPNFLHAGEKAYLGMGLRSKRLKDPALRIDELPPLDLVVLSHHHGDHFDHVAAEGLPKSLPIVTEPHAARKLEKQGFRRAIPLETWDSQELRKGDEVLRITAVPGRHSPRLLGPVIPPVMGSMLDFAGSSAPGERPDLRIYVTGDTLVHDRLAEIPRRHPDIDLCLIHLGGTRVAGILLTMDADQGVEALRMVSPETAVPIHFDDYPVFKSPLEDFLAAAEESGLRTEIRTVARGETWRFRP